MFFVFFFFKQKTAYEIKECDWSSDVCSSDLLMEARGHGNYERMDAGLLPKIYVAYRTSLSEGTEVFHSNLRERWHRGDPDVVNAMKTWAGYAEEGRACLLSRNYARLGELIDRKSTRLNSSHIP